MSLFALPVTVSDLLQLQLGIQFFTNQAEATAEAANINSPGATETVFNYAVKLLSANLSLSQVAMAVDSLMFGVTDNVAELTKLSTVFLPPQVAHAIASNPPVGGFNPTVYAAEALGLGLAGGNGTSNNFATTFGTLSITAFAQATAVATGGFIDVNAIQQFVNNWIKFYTANPTATHGLSITLASYGAAFGDAVGVALLNPTPISTTNLPAGNSLPDNVKFNVVQNEVYNALKDNAEGLYQVGVEISALPPETPLQGEGPSRLFVLTISQDTFTGTGFDTINGPLSGPFGDQPTLTSGDSLVFTGTHNILNATFNGDHTAASVNIQGIQTWNIEQTQEGTIVIKGDAIGGPNIISGLTTVNFNDDSTSGSLLIGNNLQPVQTTADGFTINVSDAIGDGFDANGDIEFNSPGVDVDIWAQGFTGHDTINVTANVVGGFRLDDKSSFVIPPEILVASDDGDDYDPAWTNYLSDAFAIAAGASAGPAGAVGFATWQVASIGAAAIGSLNIIALGGEGSTSATTINLTDDGSNTMLFATAISDSLSTDWENVATINLGGTKGFVTITGLETNVQQVSDGFLGDKSLDFSSTNFASEFQEFDGGGLLAADTAALVTITGGAGNSFYDLSSLSVAAATNPKASFDGGHGKGGNSEIAFNNAVFNSGKPVNISNIQILDDVSSLGAITVALEGGGTAILENGGESQGGIINMANFAGLQPLNVQYALLAEDLNQNGGSGAPAPFGLPFTLAQFNFTPPASQAALLPPTVTVQQALQFQNGIVPAGFDLLQLLNAEGSTQTVLGAKLSIENAPNTFAVNMQDTGDGFFTETEAVSSESVTTPETNVWTGFDINIFELLGAPPTTVNTANTLLLFLSDDGVTLFPESQPSLSDGAFVQPIATETEGNDPFGTALYVPELSIANYSTVNIVLPTESVGSGKDTQDYVILGAQDPLLFGAGFLDEPVVTVQNATVNFFDNNADNGGSPPGGEDNLVLGFTNFTATLSPADIGVASVVIDTHPIDFSTTINDFGTGSFEIGATNVTNLNAQSTSHLIMDLPAALDHNGNGGIVVNGSLLGQNLLQGTSGLVTLDTHGHTPTFGFFGSNSGPDFATVYEALDPRGGIGWGNDTLTGGNGWGITTHHNEGGVDVTDFHLGVSNAIVTYGVGVTGGTATEAGPGNTGDNFFPEGGNDVVNISPTETGTLTSFEDVDSSSGTVLIASNSPYANWSTVWIGKYDVCNNAGANAGAENNQVLNSGVGTVYTQAITDIGPDGEEVFVDGYGATGFDANSPFHTTSTPVVTINGFHFGGPLASALGDTIVFDVSSWATTQPFAGGVPTFMDAPPYGTASAPTDNDVGALILGLVESDGTTYMNFGPATYSDVNTAGAFASIGNAPAGPAAKVVLDSIGGSYANANQLQNALANDSIGSFNLAGGGMAPGTEADILVAYQLAPQAGLPNGAIAIADVTLSNFGAGTGSHANTDTANLNPVVHDLVHIATTSSVIGVSSFSAHNIDFLH